MPRIVTGVPAESPTASCRPRLTKGKISSMGAFLRRFRLRGRLVSSGFQALLSRFMV